MKHLGQDSGEVKRQKYFYGQNVQYLMLERPSFRFHILLGQKLSGVTQERKFKMKTDSSVGEGKKITTGTEHIRNHKKCLKLQSSCTV